MAHVIACVVVSWPEAGAERGHARPVRNKGLWHGSAKREHTYPQARRSLLGRRRQSRSSQRPRHRGRREGDPVASSLPSMENRQQGRVEGSVCPLPLAHPRTQYQSQQARQRAH
jgi:hypothetical protein